MAEGSVSERTGVRTEPFWTAAVARLPANSVFLLLDSSTTRAFRFFQFPGEIRVVAAWIQKLVSTDYRPAEIAILARTGQLLPLCMCAISGSMPPRLACAMVAPH